MLLTSPVARIALLLVLAALMAALIAARATVGPQQRPDAVEPQARTIAFARHSPASAAQARHAYRLQVAAAVN